MTTTIPRQRNRQPTSTLAQAAVVVAVVLAGWLVIGLLRAETVARDYFAHAAGASSTVIEVQILTVAPAIPPFWAVNITGDVIETGAPGPGYMSAMWLWVEPITGWVLVLGQG